MTSNDRMRVERAICFIRERSAGPLRLREVARAAALSEFHFHRIFSAVVGESVGRFITRTRLERAAFRLAYEPEASVTAIALGCGFSSVSNFSKAFSAHFGCAPSRVRKPDEMTRSIGDRVRRGARRGDPAALFALPREANRRRARRAEELARLVRFERREETSLACLASENGYAIPVIEETWRSLLRRVREIGVPREPFDTYGLSFDSPQLTRPESCRYHACVAYPEDLEVPPPLFRGRLPAGRYAVFPYAGPARAVERTYREIYSVWFPESSLRPGDFVPIDRYISGGPVRGHIEMEIWIRVTPKRQAERTLPQARRSLRPTRS